MNFKFLTPANKMLHVDAKTINKKILTDFRGELKYENI